MCCSLCKLELTSALYTLTHAAAAQMLHQGQHPDASDYDGRTALMLACVKGHRHVVEVCPGLHCDLSFLCSATCISRSCSACEPTVLTSAADAS